jgi:hypothetical protein
MREALEVLRAALHPSMAHRHALEGGDASADVAGKAQRVTVEHVMAATNDPWL